MKKLVLCCAYVVFCIIFMAACSLEEAGNTMDTRLDVVATTTIVGDVVSQVAGDHISLSMLLPVGMDPHSFNPNPKDIARVADADVVFVNGGGLEAFLDKLIESAGAEGRAVSVSESIDFLTPKAEHDDHDSDSSEIADHGDIDPHTWTDPENVMVWVGNIRDKLIEMDPSNARVYTANADAYLAELESLDLWITAQVSQIPQEDRKFFADHGLFEYYARAYGFEQVGALLPGFSTLAEPSAKQLADIEDQIKMHRVKAMLVGNTANPSLAERVSTDTGIQLVFIYTGSLSEPDGEAATYLDYMRYNTTAIVSALK
jgi:ABC-type Zn uptake system ZnuABC Zn-binding protein ZnuA